MVVQQLWPHRKNVPGLMQMPHCWTLHVLLVSVCVFLNTPLRVQSHHDSPVRDQSGWSLPFTV